MQVLAARDAEAALAQDLPWALGFLGFDMPASFAPPVRDDLGELLPAIMPYRTGGYQESNVVEAHYMSIDVWAPSWEAAQEAANLASGAVGALPLLPGNPSGVQWLSPCTVTAKPYNNTDMRHQDLPRVTFAATVRCRPAAREIYYR